MRNASDGAFPSSQQSFRATQTFSPSATSGQRPQVCYINLPPPPPPPLCVVRLTVMPHKRQVTASAAPDTPGVDFVALRIALPVVLCTLGLCLVVIAMVLGGYAAVRRARRNKRSSREGIRCIYLYTCMG